MVLKIKELGVEMCNQYFKNWRQKVQRFKARLHENLSQKKRKKEKKSRQTSDMAQWIKAFTTKPGDPNQSQDPHSRRRRKALQMCRMPSPH